MGLNIVCFIFRHFNAEIYILITPKIIILQIFMNSNPILFWSAFVFCNSRYMYLDSVLIPLYNSFYWWCRSLPSTAGFRHLRTRDSQKLCRMDLSSILSR